MQKAHKFDELCNKVRFCTRCERMEESSRILSRAAGPLDAKLMFIGEAPGRLGADASAIPFHGDQAGHNFEELLAFVGLDRNQAFITNAVLCNPRGPEGNNATPNKDEVGNCADYLKEQIDLVDPKIVVTLGSVALEAIKGVAPHNLRMGTSVRTLNRWYGRKLIPLYHPGTRALVHRSMANQRSDYQFVAEQLRRLDKTKKEVAGATKGGVARLVRAIVAERGHVSYFALHKLVFLVECEAMRTLGYCLSDAYFLRQKDGPYCTDLHPAKLRRAIPELSFSGSDNRLTVSFKTKQLFDEDGLTELGAGEMPVVRAVLEKTKGMSDSQLKTRVYLTAPMRKLLREERTQFVNTYNAPIRLGLRESTQDTI